MSDIVIIYEDTPKHPMVLTQEHLKEIARANNGGATRRYRSREEYLADPVDGDILITWGQDEHYEICRHMPSLKWIQSISAGVEGCAGLITKGSGLTLSKMTGVHSHVMSESAIMYILMFVHGIRILERQKTEHVWKKPFALGGDECMGKTVGIIGYGEIGREVARKCRFFGMTVYGIKRNPAPDEYLDASYSTVELDGVLPKCDFLVNLLPITAATFHMMNRSRFEKMKPEAIYISIGRGATTDTQDLIDCLNEGIIAGAALDAFEEEPLPEDSPLWDMENVLISPHCSADSPYYFDRAIPVICRNIRHFELGEAIPGTVTY